MVTPDTLPTREPREIWEIARSQLRLQMTKSTYETWVRDTSCLACEDGAFVIGVNNAYAKDWLSLRLRPTIKRTLTSIVGHAVDVTFIVQPIPLVDAPQAPSVPLLELDPPAEPAIADKPAHEAAALNPRHTFDNFIVGSSNRMAHAVALSVSDRLSWPTGFQPVGFTGVAGGRAVCPHSLEACSGHHVFPYSTRALGLGKAMGCVRPGA